MKVGVDKSCIYDQLSYVILRFLLRSWLLTHGQNSFGTELILRPQRTSRLVQMEVKPGEPTGRRCARATPFHIGDCDW